MSLFKTILEKLGIGNDDSPPTTSTTPVAPPTGVPPVAGSPNTTAPVTEPGSAAPLSSVDVTAKLDSMAAGRNDGVNWRTSIVDLLKVLGIDHSLEHRKELATELGCPADKQADSAKMNIWLHKEVLRKVASNGGTVPTELL